MSLDDMIKRDKSSSGGGRGGGKGGRGKSRGRAARDGAAPYGGDAHDADCVLFR